MAEKLKNFSSQLKNFYKVKQMSEKVKKLP